MKSLRESLIFELHSSTYANAHDKEIERAGKETNRSRRFAVAAGKALTAELKKKGLIDKKTGKIKADKTIEALPVIAAAQNIPEIKTALKNDETSVSHLQKKSGKIITLDVPAYILIHKFKCEYHKSFTIKVPDANYVIYNDKYHKMLHIATLSDMIDEIGNTIFDFEGFGPKDVVYTSNDPVDIIKHAVDTYGSWGANGKIVDTGTYDHTEWAQGVLNGTDDFSYNDGWGILELMLNYIDVMIDENGYVYNAYRNGGFEPHTEKYQDYIKRVDNELSEDRQEMKKNRKRTLVDFD